MDKYQFQIQRKELAIFSYYTVMIIKHFDYAWKDFTKYINHQEI